MSPPQPAWLVSAKRKSPPRTLRQLELPLDSYHRVCDHSVRARFSRRVFKEAALRRLQARRLLVGPPTFNSENQLRTTWIFRAKASGFSATMAKCLPSGATEYQGPEASESGDSNSGASDLRESPSPLIATTITSALRADRTVLLPVHPTAAKDRPSVRFDASHAIIALADQRPRPIKTAMR